MNRREEAMDILQRYLRRSTPFYTRRNCSIAYMELMSDNSREVYTTNTSDRADAEGNEFLASCLQHFELYGEHTFCYHDLKQFIHKFTPMERYLFLKDIQIRCEMKIQCSSFEVSGIRIQRILCLFINKK